MSGGQAEGVPRGRPSALAGRASLARLLAQRPLLALLVATGATVLSWSATSTSVSIGPDPSWAAALHLAALDGLHFGSDLIFTYGPLGWLGYPAPIYGP